MLLLNNLNEKGYNQLKKDRDILIQQIEELNSILSQFDLAYPFLTSIFEPEVKIKDHQFRYTGGFKIQHPNFEKPQLYQFTIGSLNKYKGLDDPKLIEEADLLARKKIKELFPEMFEDAGK
jgi:hypothetical protein